MFDANDILTALPLPVVLLGEHNEILYANSAAETFFAVSAKVMLRQTLSDLVPFGSPVFTLVEDVRQKHTSVTEHGLDIGTPKIGLDRQVDISVQQMDTDQGQGILLMLRERTMAEKLDQQRVNNRGATRSLSALGSMLAHEIKNPLSGIRGAAQLLELSGSEDDRALTQLICDETDRIVKLVDRMEVLGLTSPSEREPVNVHGVMDQVKRVAQSGFASNIRFVEVYDPSLPPVLANRDQLVQVLLNLVKNAAEAVADKRDGVITLTTAYRTGVRVQFQGTRERISLPIELSIQDNGPGIPEDILPDLFDPFITTKAQGSGLGLPLVTKIINEHGGIVECDPTSGKTTFRILMPMYRESF
ncbi:ATP-binding protein [Microvirga sp. W0021]|uniref:histidine kinase n=1 Tax=Hohaiivirga grylli TaxID=3133970 RepID=A0ABV0BJG9_9HYPH